MTTIAVSRQGSPRVALSGAGGDLAVETFSSRQDLLAGDEAGGHFRIGWSQLALALELASRRRRSERLVSIGRDEIMQTSSSEAASATSIRSSFRSSGGS
jgi:hypothetical protein